MKKLFFALALAFAIIASSQAQLGITGPTTVYEKEINIWYPTNPPPGTAYVRMSAGNVMGDITWPENKYQFNEYRMTITGTGKFLLSAQAEPSNEVVYFGWITVLEDPNPPIPPTPTITGASTVSAYSVEAYEMPSGKEDYEWILPSGTTSLQQWNNVKVIQFTYPGTKTIQGKYKEGGVWSHFGYKTVYVSY